MEENGEVDNTSGPTGKPHRGLVLVSQIVFGVPVAILLTAGAWASQDTSQGAPASWLVFMLGLILVPAAGLALASWVGVAIGRSRLKKGKEFWPAYLITLVGLFVALQLLASVVIFGSSLFY